MKRKSLFLVAGAAYAGAVLVPDLSAQSADALIDKLVEKGILSTREANELREEADKGFTTAYQVKSGMPDWVTSFKLNGDFRGRYEGFHSDNSAFIDRTRFRYRLRFGATAVLKDNFEVGLRLGSGDLEGAAGALASGTDPISQNQSFQNNASKKGIFLDLAYAKWAPVNGPTWGAVLTAGKMENPFVVSDLFWDADYTPEGIAAQFNYNLGTKHVARLNSGGFILDELGGDNNDPYLTGAQLRFDSLWSTKIATTFGVGVFGISGEEALVNTAVPNTNRGNSRDATGTPPSTALLYDYNPIIADAAFTYTFEKFPWYEGLFPVRVSGEYVNNPGAPSSADNEAWAVGVLIGKSGKKGTWDVGYTYKWLGADSWYEEFVDSDFGAYYAGTQPGSGAGAGYGPGTNVEGHVVKLAYSPYDSLTLSVKWFNNHLIQPVPADSESQMHRVQVDAVWKF